MGDSEKVNVTLLEIEVKVGGHWLIRTAIPYTDEHWEELSHDQQTLMETCDQIWARVISGATKRYKEKT